MRRNKHEIDMCNGPLLGKVLIFSLPLMLSGILQLLYNAADVAVVGRFAGSASLAAVGSTGSLTNMMTNLFIGMSVGASVVVAKNLGAHDFRKAHSAVHTSIALSLVAGAVTLIIGVSLSRTFLVLMDTPDDVLGLASLYMKIFFLGMKINYQGVVIKFPRRGNKITRHGNKITRRGNKITKRLGNFL